MSDEHDTRDDLSDWLGEGDPRDERDRPAAPAPGPPRPRSEGVRILGAEEAQAAIEGGQVARRLTEDAPRFGDVPPRPDPTVQPAARFPRPEAEAPEVPAAPASPVGPAVPPAADPVPGEPISAGEPGRAAPHEAEGAAPATPSPPAADAPTDEVRFEEPAAAPPPAGAADLEGLADLDALSDLDEIPLSDVEADERRRGAAPGGPAATAPGAGPEAGAERPVDGAPSESGDEPTSGAIPLPHWTEPPTGEVPRILSGDDAEGAGAGEEDLDAWAAITGSSPRFRLGAEDWEQPDFTPEEGLKDDTTSIGALAEVGEAEEEAEFARKVAARRRFRPRADEGGAPDEHAPVGTPPAGRHRRDRSSEPSAEDTGAGRRDDLVVRVVTGVGVAIAGLICLELGRGATALLAAFILAVCAFELCDGLRRSRFNPATLLVILASFTLVLAAYRRGEAAFPLVTALVVVFTMLWYMFEVVRARPVANIGVSLLAYGYVALLGGFAGLLLGFTDGVGLILGVAICSVTYDVFGYLVGSQFGRTPLAPRLSPNKTLEGLLGGMVMSIVLAVTVVSRIHPWTDITHALALGLVVAVMAPLGDLCESMLKRDLKLKDFGSLLPGHGGLLDRFDGFLFCLPAVYYLFRFLLKH